MTLIKSISGIRGTIGGKPNEGLTPIDVVKYASAFCAMMQKQAGAKQIKIAIGRDARVSGKLIEQLVVASLNAMGADVLLLGLSTTPTVEMAVTQLNAQAGIILTASHNPMQWNALKLLNAKGEFISAEEGESLLKAGEEGDFEFASVHELGTTSEVTDAVDKHIEAVLADDLVDLEAIKAADFKIVVDGVNSSGSIFVPQLLEKLGLKKFTVMNAEANGIFAHNPEPLAEHLVEVSAEVVKEQADMAIVVDPDVDRLAFVCEDGTMFGEEFTLVAVADYVLSHRKGNTVSNLSSTRALRDVTQEVGGQYFASAVGEVNVVNAMKANNAVIGGEGNGGVIYPPLHYGRDALMGIALFLSHLAHKKLSLSALRDSYPNYYISKNKIDLSPAIDVDALLVKIAAHYANEELNTIDGVKIDFAEGWVHLRKSNTEPIIRIYAEAKGKEAANALAESMIQTIHSKL